MAREDGHFKREMVEAFLAALPVHEKGTPKGVPSFVREWWAVLGLNQ